MLSSLSSSSSSAGASSPLAPEYLLRGHAAPVAVLRFSRCARFLFSGDTDGFVAVWDLRTFRPRHLWRAHEGGILGLEEVDGALLTQGRDNLLRLYRYPATAAAAGTVDYGAATAVPSPAAPSEGVERVWSLDINAMNFCRMSVCSLGVRATGKGKEREVAEGGGEEALVAVPSLTKDDFVDIFHYPTKTRVHRSVGEGAFVGQKTGTVMALHLFYLPPPVPAAPPAASEQPTAPAPSSSSAPRPPPPVLHLLIAYESGQLALLRFAPTRGFSLAPSYSASSSSPTAPPLYLPRPGVHISASEGWELVWVEKGHRDAVMSLAVTPDSRLAYTAGADHHLVAYRISDSNDAEAARPRSHTELTTAAGHAGIAVRGDGKVVATAGWDGEARIYHARTLAPLAVLSHHRTSLQALAFAPLSPARSALPFSSGGGEDSDEEEGEGEGGSGRAWLATGGQEAKIALWEVYPPRDKKVRGRRGAGRDA